MKCPKCQSEDIEKVLSFTSKEYEAYIGDCVNEYELFQCNKCMRVFSE